VAVSNEITVLGINEAIRSLNKIEPGLRKEFNNQARAIAQPATQAVRSAYRFVPLSGMNRQWAGPAVNGRKVFPWNLAKASKGVDVVFNTDRRSLGTINIVQRDTGTAIFETAGRKNSNPLGNALGPIQPGRTRVIGPVVYSKIKDIEQEMLKFALRIVNRVNGELKR
jgi:hypothetical protein